MEVEDEDEEWDMRVERKKKERMTVFINELGRMSVRG
jgi:hypothetical protein